ncbi:hypothetical protein ACYT4K_06250 [Lactococcus lactis]|uniref:hypothetical protein n=1 Tax=Lactococcus lactis TaxID=1358 RepID=UPI002078B1A9|nr:hypothetical protein [Lactococcus lactis]MDA2884810.1 hypothetical protein [Lactococcus lactis]MDA2887314.1 hypothetical protein [Lactococcus lactis]MDA2907395.1 hypothetical protein [Lactococcus lactis]MDM7534145.1 hypothetical protein [Lactococcus lactis]USI63087.1 hypothetical protein LO769_00180 [Lactococcus lactis subsp. lactis]
MTKKIILVFVEGVSDDTVFNFLLENICNQQKYKTEIIGGDPFSDNENIRKGGKTIVNEAVKGYLSKNKLKAKDIEYVAFITDADGINIPRRDFIIEEVHAMESNYIYDLDNGIVKSKNLICKTNILTSWKRKNEKLCPLMCDGVTTRVNSYNIPIGLYFNSVNLEHVTQGKILPWDKKDDAADDLIDQYENNIEGLFQIFKDKTISDNLKDSWEALKESEWRVPYSNVNILFEKIRQINEG